MVEAKPVVFFVLG